MPITIRRAFSTVYTTIPCALRVATFLFLSFHSFTVFKLCWVSKWTNRLVRLSDRHLWARTVVNLTIGWPVCRYQCRFPLTGQLFGLAIYLFGIMSNSVVSLVRIDLLRSVNNFWPTSPSLDHWYNIPQLVNTYWLSFIALNNSQKLLSEWRTAHTDYKEVRIDQSKNCDQFHHFYDTNVG